jgi:hypothetical protein
MVKKKPSALVKGIPRHEFMRQISKLPRTISPEGKSRHAENAKRARQRQMEKNGALFGRVNKAHVAEKERERQGVNLSEHRQAVDDYQ